MKKRERTTVYLNGRLVGYYKDGKGLSERLREKRRMNELNPQVNVYFKEQTNELFINTDSGRVRRPYIVVENGKSKLTSEIVDRLRKKQLNWNHLIKMGVVEFLDADEEENAYVAIREEELTNEHTHLEIDGSTIFSVVSSILPYPEHNSSPRITMACSMTKQSLGLYASNYNQRFDTRSYIMYYPQEPAVRTDLHKALKLGSRAAGQNFVVAVATYSGYNMADGLVISKGAIERGIGRVAMFRTYETEERTYPGGQKDRVEIPTPDVVGYRGEEAYRHLDEDGVVIPESVVGPRDVLVGKTSPPRFLEEVSIFGVIEEKKRENSLAVKAGERGKVDGVMITEGVTGNKVIKVRLRSPKVPEVGDKLASRHGQKGVIGLVLNDEEMPFTKDGIIPDLIINPHAIPSRMTAGHLLEMLGGKAAAIGGALMDGTAFSGNKEEEYTKILKEAGLDEYGEEVMYDGETGKPMKVKIFIGIVYYQRLHHLVSNKMHVRSRGPVQLLTLQPTEGRAREGGLRFGEMERDCLIGYGASMLIRERLLEESDKTSIKICKDCGGIVVTDYIKRRSYCGVCKSENMGEVEMSYAFKLLIDEIQSMGIFPHIVVKERGEL